MSTIRWERQRYYVARFPRRPTHEDDGETGIYVDHDYAFMKASKLVELEITSRNVVFVNWRDDYSHKGYMLEDPQEVLDSETAQ